QGPAHSDTHVDVRVRLAVDAVARWVPGSTCGTRALAMIALLAREGYASDLRLGIRRRTDGRLAAHAWVTDAAGRVISEPPEQLNGHLQVWLPTISTTTSTMGLRQ
ncbi:lasso peptide biosynthesis B2 protein, partial [Longimicrobium sp.]|uniref:lasso peptide biosynthesis B2 protein n=1 Tax=Longimicrobium sp. TaxID=2029185 RepID=UPI002E31D96D